MNSYLFIFSACYSDYFYQNRNSIYYVYHGGRSSDGSSCGAFCVNANGAFSGTSWYRGAALSFKPAV